MRYAKLWVGLSVVIITSFAVLGYFGREIYRQAPPIPERVVTTEGVVLFLGQDIKDGQNVWQSLGGQEVGSIWGHGAYVAPDWSADWLHREATWLLDHWAHDQHGKAYARLDEETQAPLRVRLQRELRTNTYQPTTGDLVVSPLRAEAIAAVCLAHRRRARALGLAVLRRSSDGGTGSHRRAAQHRHGRAQSR